MHPKGSTADPPVAEPFLFNPVLHGTRRFACFLVSELRDRLVASSLARGSGGLPLRYVSEESGNSVKTGVAHRDKRPRRFAPSFNNPVFACIRAMMEHPDD